MRLDAIDTVFRGALDAALMRYYELEDGEPGLVDIDWTPTYLISVFRTLIDLLESLDRGECRGAIRIYPVIAAELPTEVVLQYLPIVLRSLLDVLDKLPQGFHLKGLAE